MKIDREGFYVVRKKRSVFNLEAPRQYPLQVVEVFKYEARADRQFGVYMAGVEEQFDIEDFTFKRRIRL